jgi:cell wall-associated NlpC family hydrolase
LAARCRRLPALAALLAFGALLASGPFASGQAGIDGERQAAERLRAAIGAETERITATAAGLARAQRRLGVLDARARARQTQLASTQDRLIRSRIRLSRLQRREATAKRTLSDNLVAQYKAGKPQLVTIVFNATSFEDLYRRLEVLKRLSRNYARVIEETREARDRVAGETRRLEGLRTRYSRLAKAALEDRDRADALRGALLARRERQLRRRAGVAQLLGAVRSRITRLERAQAAAARRAAQAASATSYAPRVTGGNGGAVVARVVAAANQIAATPYAWGGGHGGASGGYDCSGSVSYALAAGGLLSSPLDSSGFMSWGAPGQGSRITVYANAGHAFMVVDGRRFDTSALSGGGTRWTGTARSTAGFVARHPPGL